MRGVWRKSVLAAIGSVFAFSAILEVESRAAFVFERADSAACLRVLLVDIVAIGESVINMVVLLGLLSEVAIYWRFGQAGKWEIDCFK